MGGGGRGEGGNLIGLRFGDVALFRGTFCLKNVELSVPFEETCRIMVTILRKILQKLLGMKHSPGKMIVLIMFIFAEVIFAQVM